MDGYKTYTGVVIILLSLFQQHDILPKMGDSETSQFADSILTLVGACIAVYGRFKVGEKLDTLKEKLKDEKEKVKLTQTYE